MNKKLRILFFFIFISSSLFAQYGYNLYMFEPEINDARAEALGKVSILTSTGSNCLFNDPANLSKLTCRNIQMNSRLRTGNSKRNYTNTTDDATTFYNTKYICHIKINALSIGSPINIFNNKDFKLGFAAGYRTHFDWASNKLSTNNQNENNYKSNLKYNGGFSTYILGAGLGYNEKLYCGVSFSFSLNSKFSFDGENNEGNELNSDGTTEGSFYTLNMVYYINHRIVLGVRFIPSYILKLEGGPFKVEEDEPVKHISIPPEYGLTMQINANSKFKIYVEYLIREFVKESTLNLFECSDNVYSIRSGFEFDSFAAFRGGFFIQSVPIYKRYYFYDEDLELGIFEKEKKTQKEIGVTSGIGINIYKQLTLDVYCVYSFLKYIENFNLDSGNDIREEYSYSRLKIGCSFGYSF